MLRAVIGGMGATIVLLGGGTIYLLWRRRELDAQSGPSEQA
jgi:hypothetical protein